MLFLGSPSGAGVVADERQLQLLVNNCLQCHASQETGAPRMGNLSDWAAARAGGEDAMLINLVQGIRGMPPLGYCSACSEGDFRILIRLLMGDPASGNDLDPVP
jgi:cytochrome c5